MPVINQGTQGVQVLDPHIPVNNSDNSTEEEEESPEEQQFDNEFRNIYAGIPESMKDAVYSYVNQIRRSQFGRDERRPIDISQVHSGDTMAQYLSENLTPESLDYLANYYLSEQSNVNAYKRELEADSTKYQRLVSDLKKAGLNPWLALSGLSAGSVSSGSASYGGNSFTSTSNVRKNNTANNMRTLALIGTILFRILGSIATKGGSTATRTLGAFL